MVYENIKFNRANMAVDMDGYFYMLDENYRTLTQKVDDGFISYQFPLEVPKNLLISDTLKEAVCLQFDGYSFWSLQHIYNSAPTPAKIGIVIRRWVIDNFLCKLQQQYRYDDDINSIYDSSTIAIEHYVTDVSATISGSSSEIYLSEYYNTAVFPNTTIGLGPNIYGEKEIVTVSGVTGSIIYLTDLTSYSYSIGDSAVISPSFFLFNDYDGIDNSVGSLMVFDTKDGAYISSEIDLEYQSVSASKFTRLQNILQDYDDVYTLMYVKNNSCKLRNMSDLLGEGAGYKGNDDFSDPTINSERWNITKGNPTIVDEKLYMSTAGAGYDQITSTYSLISDFDVQVSGTLYGTVPFADHYETYHFISLQEYGSIDSYMLSRTTYSGANSFDVIKDTALTYTTQATSSGVTDNYFFRATRDGSDINFYYKEYDYENWNLLYSSTLFNTECLLSLGLRTISATVSGAYFDDLIYNEGRLRFPVPTIPYYGVMNLDNIETDQATFIPIYDLDVVGDNLYRLQQAATYYGTDYIFSTYNYQISPIRPFVDFITVDSDSHIIPATGRNTVPVRSITLDQYGQGVINTPIVFVDDDSVGFMTTEIVYTDSYTKSGKATSAYTSGTDLRLVTITVTANQED